MLLDHEARMADPVLGTQRGDLERALVALLDLERGVLDAEALAQQVGELAPVRLGVAAGADGHVGGQRRHARGDLPHVQVVHLHHVVLGGERAPDLVGVEPARGRLEQHPARVAQQPPARAQHQRGHEQRGDAVGAAEVGGEDDHAGDRGRDEREQVGQHVLEGALDVEAAPLGSGQHPGGEQVHGDAGHGDHQHRRAVHRGRVDQAATPSARITTASATSVAAVDLGRQDLGALEAEREAAARRPGRRQPRGDQRQQADRAGVGEHVRRVREQRQRVGQDARHDLHGHEAEDQAERHAEPLGVAGRRVVVVMVGHRAQMVTPGVGPWPVRYAASTRRTPTAAISPLTSTSATAQGGPPPVEASCGRARRRRSRGRGKHADAGAADGQPVAPGVPVDAVGQVEAERRAADRCRARG